MDRDDMRMCLTCGHLGRPEEATAGNRFIELVLWCCFIIPGLLYSIWRRSSARDVCEKCGSDKIAPLDTPAAKALIAQYGLAEQVPPPRRPSAAAYSGARALGSMFSKRR